jgi:hypothetical protein
VGRQEAVEVEPLVDDELEPERALHRGKELRGRVEA